MVIVKGRVDKRDDAPKLIAQSIDVLEVGDGVAEPLRVRVPPQLLSQATVAHLKQILADHPGVRRCSSTSASGRSFACPNAGTSTRRTVCSGSSRWCWERARSLREMTAARVFGYPSCTWRAV